MRFYEMNIPLAKPIFDEEMKNAAIISLQNEKFVMGESVFKFEEEFAKFCGVKRAVSTSSGTFALQLALQALDLTAKDEVVTTPFSFIATANAAYCTGAKPVFSDIDTKTFNLNPSTIRCKINRNTKVVMPVHLYGNPADLDPLIDAARGAGCATVEDCCQAHGAEYSSKKVGSIGDVGCFSFYSAKNMTVGGDGGMAVTNNEETANKIARLRDCGRRTHYEHDVIGLTARLNTVNAAIGRVQLKKLDEWNKKRRSVAKKYNERLADVEGIILPPNENGSSSSVYHLYVIRTDCRTELKDYLEKNGIQCGIHYPLPIHLQPVYKQLYGYKEGDYPESERVSKQVLSLPMFPNMKDAEIEYVSEKIHKFFTRCH